MFTVTVDITAHLMWQGRSLVAEILGGQEAPTALREMKGLDGHAVFVNVDSKFNFTRCIR